MENVENINWFAAWFNSPYYHLLYNNRSDAEAEDFINKLISFLNPKAESRMLDIACGKGRHSRGIADKGFDVVGIDLAEESIAFAKQFETDKLHFYEHDMRRLFWINYFDYAFNFFTSIGYFHTDREDTNAFHTFASALKPGGVLVIDFINATCGKTNLIAEQTIIRDEIKFEINKRADEKFFYKTIKVTDAGKQFTFCEKVRAFTLTDFETLLTAQNMSITHTFGDYELNAFDVAISKRLIVVAKKAV